MDSNKIMCPATGVELSKDYCNGNCINCPWVSHKPPDMPVEFEWDKDLRGANPLLYKGGKMDLAIIEKDSHGKWVIDKDSEHIIEGSNGVFENGAVLEIEIGQITPLKQHPKDPRRN